MNRRLILPLSAIFVLVACVLVLAADWAPVYATPVDQILDAREPASAEEDALATAIAAALTMYQTPDRQWGVDWVSVEGDWGAGIVTLVDPKTGNYIPAGPQMVLGRKIAGRWIVELPFESGNADRYNQWLTQLPVSLIPIEEKMILYKHPQEAPRSTLNVSGYRLPWRAGVQAYVTSNASDHGYPALDFDIQGSGTSGDVLAAKSGQVVFRKDSSTTGCSSSSCWRYANIVVIRHSDSEYSWYMHLAPGSIPSGVQEGSAVSHGDKIGVEGQTGWAAGVHLHFHVASSYGGSVGSGDTRVPAWPGSFQFVDFAEYNWTNIQSIGGKTSQNSGSRCVAPSLISPSDDETASNRTITFRWNALSGCTFNGYTFRVCSTADVNSPGNCFIDAGEGNTRRTETINGRDDQELWWGVRAANAPQGADWAIRRFRIHVEFTNGGFEAGSGDTPDIWRSETIQGDGSFTWDNAVAHAGSWSVKISASQQSIARWWQVIAVDEDSEYELAGWIKTSNVQDPSGQGRVNGARLGVYGMDSYLAASTDGLNGTHDWTHVTTRFVTGKTTRAKVTCTLGEADPLSARPTSSGTMWCDDLTLTKVRTLSRTSLEGRHVALDMYTEDYAHFNDPVAYVALLDEVYNAMAELVNGMPFSGDRVTIRSDASMYYDLLSGNPILIGQGHSLPDVVNEHGIDFGVPHEIGHDFDLSPQSNLYMGQMTFDNAEHWANLKLLYAYDVVGASHPQLTAEMWGQTVPISQVGQRYVEVHAQPWIDSERTDYQNMHNDVYTGLLYTLRQRAGWGPFRATFHEFSRSAQTSPSTDLAKVELWANTLGRYAGMDFISAFQSWGFPIRTYAKMYLPLLAR